MLTTVAFSNYRSLRDVAIPLGTLTVIAGANGSGKSNLYRALRLLADCAGGKLVSSLAREGGLASTLWAGPERLSSAMRSGRVPVQGTVRRDTIALKLGFGSDSFGYSIELGLPSSSHSAFSLDPEIKRECIWAGPTFRRAGLTVERRGPAIRATDENGVWQSIPVTLAPFESMMTEFADPRSAPEMMAVRERLRSWRFYDHLRTDIDAPVRRPQVGTHTAVLGNDGADLAAALQTIREIGDAEGLDQAVSDAFPGTQLELSVASGWFEISLRQHGLLRPLKGSELSDGTLRYLLLVAALLTPRPPELLVLNEPETSLHGDLIPALARLIIRASERSQLIVVTHSEPLVELLGAEPESGLVKLEKSFGETSIPGSSDGETPAWRWPER